MNELVFVMTAAIVFAADGPDPSLLGSRVSRGEPIPAEVRGVLVPERGVLQLEPGARVRVDREGRWFQLGSGRVRVVASAALAIEAGGWLVLVEEAEALVSADGAGGGSEVEVCAVGSGVTVRRAGVGRAEAGDGGGSDGVSDRVGPDRCVVLGPEGRRSEGALAPSRRAELALALEAQRPPPADLPDLLGDLTAQVAELEEEWTDRLDRGPEREAASCGCTEEGGSGGGFGSGGSGTRFDNPEPPPAEPGTLRVRIRLPRRR